MVEGKAQAGEALGEMPLLLFCRCPRECGGCLEMLSRFELQSCWHCRTPPGACGLRARSGPVSANHGRRPQFQEMKAHRLGTTHWPQMLYQCLFLQLSSCSICQRHDLVD